MTTRTRTRVRVGTRGSKLAVLQTGLVVDLLAAAHPEMSFELVRVSTAGDRDKRTPLEKVGVSIFVKELEAALEDGRADVAVHSLKDMPSLLPDGFALAAVAERGDPRDALVDRMGRTLAALPPGARIGTSSPRRASQIRSARPDIEVLPIRGNVDTRLTKALGGDETGYDGAVLAAAGLERLGRLDTVSEFLDPDLFIPAAGQGALAVEVLSGDAALLELIGAIDHRPSRAAGLAERAFLAGMGAGCANAAAAYATLDGAGGDGLTLRAWVSDLMGKRPLTRTVTGAADDPETLGKALADEMIGLGARELILGEG